MDLPWGRGAYCRVQKDDLHPGNACWMQDEVAFVRRAMGHDKYPQQEYLSHWETAVKDFIWLPSKKRYDRNASATNTERLQSIQVRLYS